MPDDQDIQEQLKSAAEEQERAAVELAEALAKSAEDN